MAYILFWFNISVIFYVYAGYSLLICLLSFLIHKETKKKDIEPSVSFLIAAYNEEKNIRQKLQDTLNLEYPKDKLEIIVVSDGSTDKTDAIAKEFSKERVFLYRVEGRVGKTEARNRAVKIAKGEIVIFSDATTVYDRFAIKNMVRNFADPSVGAVSGRYDYLSSGKSSLGLANILFWRYENLIKTAQSKVNTLTGMSGCINSFRKNLYEPLPSHIIEDLVEPLKILEKGYRIVFEPEALAYELTTDTVKQEFKMRVRVITQGMTGLLYMRSIFNPFKYSFIAFQLFSHKVLRWLIPFFMIGLFISNSFIFNRHILYKAVFLLQVLFYSMAVLGLLLQQIKIKQKLLGLPLYFCTLNFAALIASFNIIRSSRIHKWDTVR